MDTNEEWDFFSLWILFFFFGVFCFFCLVVHRVCATGSTQPWHLDWTSGRRAPYSVDILLISSRWIVGWTINLLSINRVECRKISCRFIIFPYNLFNSLIFFHSIGWLFLFLFFFFTIQFFLSLLFKHNQWIELSISFSFFSVFLVIVVIAYGLVAYENVPNGIVSYVFVGWLWEKGIGGWLWYEYSMGYD